MLGNLNCTMDEIERVDENTTQRLYRCRSNYALILASESMEKGEPRFP